MSATVIKDCYMKHDTLTVTSHDDRVSITCQERAGWALATIDLDIEGVDRLLAALYGARSHLCGGAA